MRNKQMMVVFIVLFSATLLMGTGASGATMTAKNKQVKKVVAKSAKIVIKQAPKITVITSPTSSKGAPISRLVPKVTSLDISAPTEMDIDNYDKVKVKVITDIQTSKQYTVKYISNDPSIISIDDDGNLKAVGCGTTSINAEVNDIKTTASITVNPLVTALTAVVNSDPINGNILEVNTKAKIEVVITTMPQNKQAKVFYNSSDNSIATVDKDGYVTAINSGNVIITVATGAQKVDIPMIIYDEASKNTSMERDNRWDPKQESLAEIMKYHKKPNYDDEKSLLKFGTLSKDTYKVEELAKQVNNNRDISALEQIFKIVKSIPDADFYGDGQTNWDVDKVIENGKRHCGDYATLFGALTRAKGIPTLEVTAYDMAALCYNNSNYKKGIWSGNFDGHELLEVKLSDGKWYLVDSTRGDAYLDYDRNNFLLPNGYIAFAKETDEGNFGSASYMAGIIQYFLTFNVDNYKDPLYKYIDLASGDIKNSEPYKINIAMGRDPLVVKSNEINGNQLNLLYSKMLFGGVPTEEWDSNTAKRNDISDHNLIYLYAFGKPIPQELEKYFPQIKNMKPGDVYYYTDFSHKSSPSIGPTVKLLIVGNESENNSFDSVIQSLDYKKVYGLN